MAKRPNYNFEKNRREQERKKRREEKRLRKLENSRNERAAEAAMEFDPDAAPPPE